MENIIEIKDLRKKYGKFEALKGVDLTLGKSEILGFIGPNGAGKTTTIRIILGMLKGEGNVKVFGMMQLKFIRDFSMFLGMLVFGII